MNSISYSCDTMNEHPVDHDAEQYLNDLRGFLELILTCECDSCVLYRRGLNLELNPEAMALRVLLKAQKRRLQSNTP